MSFVSQNDSQSEAIHAADPTSSAAGRGLLSGIIRDSALTGAGLLASNVFSFAFTFIAARTLGPGGYGWLGALLGIYGFASVCSGAIMPAVTSVVTSAWVAKSFGTISRLLATAAAVCISTALLLGVVGALSRALLSRGAEDTDAYGLTGMLVGLTFLVAIWTATLRGVHRFRRLAILLALDPLARLVAGSALLTGGLGVRGAVIAYLVGVLVFLAGGLTALRDFFTHPPGPIPVSRLVHFSQHGAVLTAAQAVYTAAPPILAWQLLAGEDAGYVVAALALANVMVPFLDAISTAAYPRMVVTAGAGRSARTHFALVSALIGVAGAVAVGILVLGAEPIVALAYGPAFRSATTLLPPFALSRWLVGLLTAFTSLGFAEGRFRFIFAWVLSALLQAGGLLTFGTSAIAFAWIVLLSTAVCVVVVLVDLWSRNPQSGVHRPNA